MNLRPYQKEAADKVFEEWKENTSTLVVMPTGTGKTILFADIIRRKKQPAIVITHREELIFQAGENISAVTRPR